MQQSPNAIGPSAEPRFTLSKKIGIVFLALLLLGLGNSVIVNTMFAKFRSFDETMRVVGSLRFLGHKIALNTSAALNGWSPGKEAALSDIAQYEDGLNALMHPGADGNQVRQLTAPQRVKLEEIGVEWHLLREKLESALRRNGTPHPDTSQLIAVLAENTQDLLDHVQQLMGALIGEMHREQEHELKITYLLLLVNILLLGGVWFLVRAGFVRPLLRLAQGSRELANGNYQVQIEYRFNDEVGQLTEAFNDATQRIGTLVGNLEMEHRNLLRAESMFRGVAETRAVGVYIVQDNKFVYVNARAAQMFGVEKHTLLESMDIFDMIAEIDHDRLKINAQERLNGTMAEGLACEYQARRQDGSQFDLAVYSSNMTLNDRPAVIGIAMDVTDKKKIEDLVWRQANFDSLTELPNRMMFHDRLEQEIRKSHRTGLSMALIFIDLDHFKEVNDTLGHAAGDLLLQEAAQRLSKSVREIDTVARLGGDEFTIILGELARTTDVERIVQDVLKSMADPIKLGDKVAHVSASIGVTFYPNDATEVDDLLKNADQAMYVAKNLGRNRSYYFTADIEEEV